MLHHVHSALILVALGVVGALVRVLALLLLRLCHHPRRLAALGSGSSENGR